jgi:hypothetical protein
MVQNLTLPTGLSQGDPKLLPSSLCHRDLPTNGSLQKSGVIGQNNDFSQQKTNVAFCNQKFGKFWIFFFFLSKHLNEFSL